jgi:hypothetical protein
MEAQGKRMYSSYSFMTSELDGGEWSTSRPGRTLPHTERTPGTHWTGGWVGPRAGLDTEDRGKARLPLPGIKPRSPGRPVRSQTLYWLSYSCYQQIITHFYFFIESAKQKTNLSCCTSCQTSRPNSLLRQTHNTTRRGPIVNTIYIIRKCMHVCIFGWSVGR